MSTRNAWPHRSALMLVTGILLTSAIHPAFGLSIRTSTDCAGMCSPKFWESASPDTVAFRLSKSPAARGHLRKMLWAAVMAGNVRGVAALLRTGAPPNSRENKVNGRFLLQEAAARGNGQIVSLLLKAGAFPNVTFKNGGTALHVAAGFGRVDAVTTLLGAGADPRAPDSDGITVAKYTKDKIENMVSILMEWGWFIRDLFPPLPPPCRKCRKEVLALLKAPPPVPRCGKLCTPEFWKTADEKRVRGALARAPAGARLAASGGSPLHRAIAAGVDLPLVKLLLDRGLDPNGRDIRDDTPLHIAARMPGARNAIMLLLERGAILEAMNALDRTPLHAASERASTLDNMRALLDAGANPHVRAGGTIFDPTPRHVAVSQPEGSQGAELILRYGGPVGNARKALQDLLFAAVRSGHPDTLYLLEGRGVDVMRSRIYGDTPLHAAAAAGNVGTMRVLLQKGADPNYSKYDRPAILSGEGKRPLHLAVPHPAAVALLLEFGADPNGRIPRTSMTPVDIAARKCANESLGLLLKHGGDPNARRGWTPLHGAIADIRGLQEWKRKRLASCEEDHKNSKARLEQCRKRIIQQHKETYRTRNLRECERSIVTLVEFGARSDIGGKDSPLEIAKRYKLDKSIVNILKRAR